MNYTNIIEDHPFIIRDHNKCISCGQCLTACPCGALDYKRESDKVFEALNDPDKIVVGFTAPAVRTVLAEKYNIKSEDISAFMAGLLKKMSFDYVYDFTFAADLTIVEETTEFIDRLSSNKVLPHFTSCCPGWVNFVERRYPHMIPHLSSCKSPQQMMGATVRNHFPQWAEKKLNKKDVFIVSIVPCLAKKYEAAREEFSVEGVRDVDAVLTTTEVLEMIEISKLDVKSVKPSSFDEPYKNVSGAGILFGVSEVLLKHHCGYDLIEVMACPGGCIAGAGHPVPEDSRVITKRKEFLLDLDKKSENRKSHENPDVKKLYEDFYGDANSHLAHKLLHTEYTDRSQNSDVISQKRELSAYAEKEISVCVDKHCFKKDLFKFLKHFRRGSVN